MEPQITARASHVTPFIEGKGAADAAYSTALEIEYCRVMGIKYSGGAADIYKCFDQVRRDIVYKLLEAAGMLLFLPSPLPTIEFRILRSNRPQF